MGALAHDLKTPLTVIRGNVQLMGEAESLEEAQKYSLALEQEIQGIEEYLQILQEMISTGGYQMYKKEQVDIRELTGQFRERIEAAAAGKKQTIQFECENLPKWICVNEKLLIRSWENLVYNAIEYTPQGGMIRICISEGKEQLEICSLRKTCFIRETKADIPGNITGWDCIWQSNLQKKTEEVLHWPTLRG